MQPLNKKHRTPFGILPSFLEISPSMKYYVKMEESPRATKHVPHFGPCASHFLIEEI